MAAREAPQAGEFDAVIVGAGLNALVTALHLGKAGWSTLLLERAERPGGAIRSAEITRPGFVHDVYATNAGPFLASPATAPFKEDLARHGLEFAHCAHPFANVFPDGSALRLLQGPEKTFAELERHDPLDAAGFKELAGMFERVAPGLFGVYGTRLDARSLARTALTVSSQLGPAGMRDLGRLLVSSTRELTDSYLHSPEAKALVACWGMHSDFGPDVAGGALIPLLESFGDMVGGIAIVHGGASRLIEAMVALGGEHGMELRTEAEVARVEVSDGRATGVVLADGERIGARRAVIANLAPRLLYDNLLADANPPASLRQAARRYRYGPGSMMVHLALSGPPRWAAGEDLSKFGYVHIGPYVDDLTAVYGQATSGLLPAEPMLAVAQTSSVDPTRAPEGAVLRIEVRALPAEIRGDAGGTIAGRTWEQAGEAYADRALAKLERYAPGIGELVLDRAVLTPADLERDNPNLIGGDPGSGSMHLRQNFLFRPFPEVGDYETGVDGLLMTGAATWPGGGLNGISGFNVARKLLAGRRSRWQDTKLALGAARAGRRALGA